MTLDNRTEAERRYDETRLSRAPIADPWEPIVEVMLDAVKPDKTAYDWDRCIAVLQALEDAIGIPPGSDEVSGRMFDKETADTLDVFTGWWGKARKQRQDEPRSAEPDNLDRAYAHGAAAANLTFLLRALDDDRADDLMALIEDALELDPEARGRLADSVLTACR